MHEKRRFQVVRRQVSKKTMRREESPYKRDSVEDNHSSGITVAGNLMRRYPRASGCGFPRTQRSKLPYSVLLRLGFTKPIRLRIAGERLPHRFTLTGPIARLGSFLFCGTFRASLRAVVNSQSCRWKSRLSST